MAKNEFIKDFLSLSKERFSVDSINMTMTDWVCKNTTLKNRPFRLKGYEFQEQILNDMHPNMDVIKISQVGLTELQIRKALAFLKRNNGTSLIFSLPNEDMYKRISNGRVKPIVNKDSVFTTPWDKENKVTRSVDMMQFGQSFLYLVPSIESAATSISADVVFNDEIDLSNQKMIALFNSRLQGSKYKISQRFSTPTFPSYGIDLNWRSSDQHVYLCKCDKCNHWNNPEFDWKFINLPGAPDVEQITQVGKEYSDDIIFSDAYVKCEKCGSALDLGNPEIREWVPTYPNRQDSRGYRVGPFATANLDVFYIMNSMWKYQKEDFTRGFYNTVLGLPYSDGSMQIPFEAIEACLEDAKAPNLSEYDNLWIGIDMGQTCHITIGSGYSDDNINVIELYTVKVQELVGHVKELFENYNFIGGTVDRHPYEPTARELMEVTHGKILPVEYRGAKDINLVNNSLGELSHVQVNRTIFLDNLAQKVRKGSIKISGYGILRKVIIEHLRDMVRDEQPDKETQWVKLNGNDHFFHSMAFMLYGPKVTDVIRFKDKEDQRTSVFSSVVTQEKQGGGLIGMTNKNIDYW